MLSDFIIIFLALTIPVSAFLSFRAGYGAGRAAREGGELPPILPPVREKPGAMTEEQRRVNAVLANIDAYDGTEEGQVKI